MERRIIYLVLIGLGLGLVILGLIFGTKKSNRQPTPSSQPSATLPKPIVVWGIIKPQDIQPIILDFEKITNQKVNYTYLAPSEIYKEFLEKIAAGYVPDVLIIDNHLLNVFQDKIQPIINKNQVDIWPFLKEILSDEENLLAFPLFLDPIVLGSLKTSFYSLGLRQNPATFDELNQLILNLKNKNLDIYLINFGTLENNPWAPEIVTSMALNFGAQPKNIFQNFPQAWTQALVYYFSFSDPHNLLFSFAETQEDLFELFLKNKILMTVAPLSFFKELQKINPQLDFLISSFPAQNLLSRQSLVNFYMGIIPKLSSNSQAGKKFLSYFYNFPDKIYATFGLIPSKNNYFNVGDLSDWWQKESLVAKSVIFPSQEIIFSFLRKIKVEINYNQNVGESWINNFK